jgi:glycosyltransferase involved in cell wall biosynthesis
MLENISKRPELLIVSDTAVQMDDQGRYLAFEPVVREIEHFSHLFSNITWIASRYPVSQYAGNRREVLNDNVRYVLLSAVGGKGLCNKMRIIQTYIRLIFMIPRYVKKADVIHTRGPSHPALITIIYSILFFREKIFWHKYAGNWIRQNENLSYRANKFLLKKAGNTIVTINGKWPDQKSHILSFENPCLTIQERIDGAIALSMKSYSNELDFVYVGAMVHTKGVSKIIEAFGELQGNRRIGILHLVGDGPERDNYEKLASRLKVKCRFYKFLSREDVNKVLTKVHVLILASQSEGFPKVIAEGANFGCIPVVTNISCISQYIQDGMNGFILDSSSAEVIVNVIQKVIAIDGACLADIAGNGHMIGEKFTYNHYNNRIVRDILKQDYTDTDA